MNNKPVAWMHKPSGTVFNEIIACVEPDDLIPLYTHPTEHDLGIAEAIGFDKGYKVATAKTLTDEDIAKVVHELNQKANTPDRWVTAMQIGAETIIQLRDELAILRKAQEK